MIENIEQATAVLADTNAVEADRVAAVDFIGEDGSETSIELLVQTLHDDVGGVRWAAADQLARLGDAAMPALLRELASPNIDMRLRDSARHIFHTSSSQKVQEDTQDILKAMHGSSQSISIMTAASDLMIKYRIA